MRSLPAAETVLPNDRYEDCGAADADATAPSSGSCHGWGGGAGLEVEGGGEDEDEEAPLEYEARAVGGEVLTYWVGLGAAPVEDRLTLLSPRAPSPSELPRLPPSRRFLEGVLSGMRKCVWLSSTNFLHLRRMKMQCRARRDTPR